MPRIHSIQVPRDQSGVSQDACFHHTRNGVTLLAVADGVGGLEGGRAASRHAVRVLMTAPYSDMLFDTHSGRSPGRLLVAAAKECHRVIAAEALDGATTLVALRVGPRFLSWTWVGDSRLYRVTEDTIELLTTDDSVVEQERQKAARGERGPVTAGEEMEMGHIITQALGVPSPEPNTGFRAHAPNELYVLCTDGFYDACPPGPKWQALLREGPGAADLLAMEERVCRTGPGDDSTALFYWTGAS